VQLYCKCIHPQVVNIITSLHIDSTRTKRDERLNSTKKGKTGELKSSEHFINIFESLNYGYLLILSYRGMGTSHQVVKVNSEGDKCPVLGTHYILSALVYFGDEYHF
jgi:hypothetical protein